MKLLSIAALVVLPSLACDSKDESKSRSDKAEHADSTHPSDGDEAKGGEVAAKPEREGTPETRAKPAAEAEQQPKLPPVKNCEEFLRRVYKLEKEAGIFVLPEERFLADLEDEIRVCELMSEEKRACMFAISSTDDFSMCGIKYPRSPEEQKAYQESINASRVRAGLEPIDLD